eukprot:1005304_1
MMCLYILNHINLRQKRTRKPNKSVKKCTDLNCIFYFYSQSVYFFFGPVMHLLHKQANNTTLEMSNTTTHSSRCFLNHRNSPNIPGFCTSETGLLTNNLSSNA